MFDIDLMSRVPIYEQLYRKVIELVSKGVLTEQDKLPSVRSLATELSVNPNTVAKAYALLERDGIIHTIAGRGSFVAKPDAALIEKHLLAEFDTAAEHALDAGISSKTLSERLQTLTEPTGTKEDNNV